jgi:hypothetical protein
MKNFDNLVQNILESMTSSGDTFGPSVASNPVRGDVNQLETSDSGAFKNTPVGLYGIEDSKKIKKPEIQRRKLSKA